jgi:hypothetical protein
MSTAVRVGHGVHWPDVDEDISAEGMLSGIPAHRPKGRLGTTTPANRVPQSIRRARRNSKSKTRKGAAHH